VDDPTTARGRRSPRHAERWRGGLCREAGGIPPRRCQIARSRPATVFTPERLAPQRVDHAPLCATSRRTGHSGHDDAGRSGGRGGDHDRAVGGRTRTRRASRGLGEAPSSERADQREVDPIRADASCATRWTSSGVTVSSRRGLLAARLPALRALAAEPEHGHLLRVFESRTNRPSRAPAPSRAVGGHLVGDPANPASSRPPITAGDVHAGLERAKRRP
jgi:hypothetical protein